MFDERYTLPKTQLLTQWLKIFLRLNTMRNFDTGL